MECATFIVSYGQSHVAVGAPSIAAEPIFYASNAHVHQPHEDRKTLPWRILSSSLESSVNSSLMQCSQAGGSSHPWSGIDFLPTLLEHCVSKYGPVHLCVLEPVHSKHIKQMQASMAPNTCTNHHMSLPAFYRNIREHQVVKLFDLLRDSLISLSLVPVPTAALYAVGLVSGTVLDVGDSHTSLMAVYKSRTMRTTLCESATSGSELVPVQQPTAKRSKQHDVASHEDEWNTNLYFEAAMPDGNRLMISTNPVHDSNSARTQRDWWSSQHARLQDAFSAYHVRISQSIVSEQGGVDATQQPHRTYPESVEASSYEYAEARKNVVVTGGVANAKTFVPRLREELWARPHDAFHVVEAPRRLDLALLPYIGASIAFHSFPVAESKRKEAPSNGGTGVAAPGPAFVTREELQESGPSIIHSRFLY